MLAQRQEQQPKYVLLTSQSLSDTTSVSLKKAYQHQQSLHKLLSEEIEVSEERSFLSSLLSFKIFVNEVKDQLESFMAVLDEISIQMNFFNEKNLEMMAPFAYNLEPERSSLEEIFKVTETLCGIFTVLDKQLNNNESQIFLKNLVRKSLVFYKQTNVVLKGYLRIYKV